jgi:hypothetical protein
MGEGPSFLHIKNGITVYQGRALFPATDRPEGLGWPGPAPLPPCPFLTNSLVGTDSGLTVVDLSEPGGVLIAWRSWTPPIPYGLEQRANGENSQGTKVLGFSAGWAFKYIWLPMRETRGDPPLLPLPKPTNWEAPLALPEGQPTVHPLGPRAFTLAPPPALFRLGPSGWEKLGCARSDSRPSLARWGAFW